MARPVIILGLPRSGSSMIAGIFALHGVWTGTCKPANWNNEKGYFENIYFRQYMRENIFDKKEIEKRRNMDGYSGGPWLWKILSEPCKAYDEFDPLYVICWRFFSEIYQSIRASNIIAQDWSDVYLKTWILKRLDLIMGIDGIKIDTSMVAKGELSVIRAAIEAYDLEFDDQKTREFVDESLWHFHS